MTLANLAVWIVLGSTPAAEARELVERLGSPRYAEREEAATALEKHGRTARPVLVQALSSRDPEVRSRAAALLARIDSDLMTRPTLVALDFEDRPLEEVVRVLGERGEASLSLEVNNLPAWTARTIALVAPEPVPFWTAIDRLCRAANLQYSATSPGPMMGRGTTLRLLPGQQANGPTCDSGPFRVTLVSVHFQRDLMLARTPSMDLMPPGMIRGIVPAPPPIAAMEPAAVAPVHEQFYVQMQLLAEPRLTIGQTRELKLTEAIDERGQSLLPADSGVSQRFAAYSGFGAAPVLQMPIALSRPDLPGKTIVRLRGALPVTVSVRKPDPLVVPLVADSVGKVVRNATASVTIEDLNPVANNHQPTTIGLLVRIMDDPHATESDPAGPGQGFRQAVPFQNQFEVLDERGRTLSCFVSPRSSAQPEGTHLQLTIVNAGETGPPAEVRFYNLSEASTEVDFEFQDVPIP